MKKVLLFGVVLLLVATNAWAGYTVTTSVQDLGDSYKYIWTVKAQGLSSGTGLSEFVVAIPLVAIVRDSRYPDLNGAGYDTIMWTSDMSSTYVRLPSGYVGATFKKQYGYFITGEESAIFSLTASKTTVPGYDSAYTTTFVGGSPAYVCSSYGFIIGPSLTPVPEPTSFLVLLGGFAGLVLARRQR